MLPHLPGHEWIDEHGKPVQKICREARAIRKEMEGLIRILQGTKEDNSKKTLNVLSFGICEISFKYNIKLYWYTIYFTEHPAGNCYSISFNETNH